MEEKQNNVNMGLEGDGGSNGLVVGAIVILAIIILGGLYFWSQRVGEKVSTDEVIENINQQNNSDEAATIEADLDATDIENLDAELNAS
ncbi:MAG: hypothetical protein Q8Q22_01245 [bacterium]|nr:hypothetical protein [bacterium]